MASEIFVRKKTILISLSNHLTVKRGGGSMMLIASMTNPFLTTHLTIGWPRPDRMLYSNNGYNFTLKEVISSKFGLIIFFFFF